MPTFVELEKQAKYSQFYAPFARVLVEGKDLLLSGLEVTSVSVDLTLEGMDQFNFVINNAFDMRTQEFLDNPKVGRLDVFFDFGRRVEIFMGYLDKSSATQLTAGQPMFTGVITSFRTGFPASGTPQITVSGYDLTYCMTKGKKSRPPWNKKKDSDVVAEIAGEYGLTPKTENTRVEHPRIEQSQETDHQFIAKLAERNGFEFYVRNNTLFFKEPAYANDGVITLEWGKGLLGFTPEINLNEQITEVQVTGWNINTKQPIVGKAKIGDEVGRNGRDRGRQSGGEYLRSVCPQRNDPVHHVRIPVYSLDEANRRARAILKKVSEGLLKGSGESIGIPEILPDTNIKIKGIGEKFGGRSGKAYYIEKATHTVNASGYKTTFNVKDTII